MCINYFDPIAPNTKYQLHANIQTVFKSNFKRLITRPVSYCLRADEFSFVCHMAYKFESQFIQA